MNIFFDKVYVISYVGFIPRQKRIKHILNDILGINFEFIYGADYSIFKHIVEADIPHGVHRKYAEENNMNDKYYTHFWGASVDHLTAIKHAYCSDCNSVLIFEDSALLINDIQYIYNCLNNIPKNADIIQYGYINRFIIKNKADKSNQSQYDYYQYLRDEYNNLDKNNVFSKVEYFYPGSQCYGLCNREIIKRYIYMQYRDFACIDNAINLHFKNFNKYLLTKQLVISSKQEKYIDTSIYNLGI